MPRPKRLVIGGTGIAVLSMRLARSLHARWRRLPAPERERIEPLAEAAKEQALDVRGASDPDAAAAELRSANETLAAALVESAEANPDVSADEVARLRGDLKRELERLAEADVKALRTGLPAEPRG